LWRVDQGLIWQGTIISSIVASIVWMSLSVWSQELNPKFLHDKALVILVDCYSSYADVAK